MNLHHQSEYGLATPAQGERLATGLFARRPRRASFGGLPAALAAAVMTMAGVASAQSEDGSDVSREYAIKAAYLYQFGRYVQWPPKAFATPESPLVIGVLGPDPFGEILDEIARTKRVDGRPIVVRRFATMKQYTPCHILFVGASVEPDQRAAAIERAGKEPVLLVGEEPGFAEQGGVINFFLDDNRVRFEINANVVKRDQLKISSKLLSLAKIVGTERYQ